MKTAMENIREMVDANTIIGDPVETPDGDDYSHIKGFLCFAAGGSDLRTEKKGNRKIKNLRCLLAAEAEAGFPFSRWLFWLSAIQGRCACYRGQKRSL